MALSNEMIRALDSQEKTEISARLRGGESPHDLAFQFRVPALWVVRIADAIERARINAEREKQRRSRVQSLAARGRTNAQRLQITPPIEPSMKALCSMDRIRVSVRKDGVDHE